jgi:hypothetical protein
MRLLPKLMYSHCNERRPDARQQEGGFVRECGVINRPGGRSQSLAGDRRREALGGVGRALRDLQSDRVVVALRNLLFGSAALASASASPLNNFSTVGLIIAGYLQK